MHRIVTKQVLAPQTKLIEVYTPEIARKARAGQFVILRVDERGTIVIVEKTGKTSLAGVYAGSNVVSGAAPVIRAMGAGKKAATSKHQYLAKKNKKGRSQKHFP